MDDGNWTTDLADERRQYAMQHIECIRETITKLRDDRRDDKELFVKLTQCIGSLYGLKEEL